MTLDKMAAELKAKGWRVEPPITQENCKHPIHMTIGSAGMGADGSTSSTWHCRLCGKSTSFSTPPNPARSQFYCWN